MDGTHFSPKSTQGEFMYVTSKNIQNGYLDLSNVSYISKAEHEAIYKRCPVRRNDVLLTKDGANTGNCAINTLDVPFSLLSSVAVIRGNADLIDQKFIYFSLLTDYMQGRLRGSMSGQAITRITLEKINAFEISIPNLAEQEEIASCLNDASSAETATENVLGGLHAHKAALMQQLFPSLEEVAL